MGCNRLLAKPLSPFLPLCLSLFLFLLPAQECVTQVPVVTLVAPDTVPPLKDVAAHVVSHVIQEQIAVGEDNPNCGGYAAVLHHNTSSRAFVFLYPCMFLKISFFGARIN